MNLPSGAKLPIFMAVTAVIIGTALFFLSRTEDGIDVLDFAYPDSPEQEARKQLREETGAEEVGPNGEVLPPSRAVIVAAKPARRNLKKFGRAHAQHRRLEEELLQSTPAAKEEIPHYPGDEVEPPAVPLVEVTSSPSGVMVEMNGEIVGVTPFVAPADPAWATVTIRLSSPDLKPVEETLSKDAKGQFKFFTKMFRNGNR